MMKAPQRILTAQCLFSLLTLNSVQGFLPSSPLASTARPTSVNQQQLPSLSSFQWDKQIKETQYHASSSTSLMMVPAASTATVAAITGAITGGLFAGGLHAIAGELISVSVDGSIIQVHHGILSENHDKGNIL
jgi:hypothetical protein